MTRDSPGSTQEKPLSVILTAFNRRQFLRESLHSALRQSLPSAQYEIVVLTNFPCSDADVPPDAANVRVVHDDSPNAGQTLARGIREARGRIVTFLDDDDLYHTDRLARILRYFDLVPDLCYYHNAFTLFWGAPSPTDSPPKLTEVNSVLGSFRANSGRGPPRADSAAFLRFLSGRNRERNMSSTAITREFGLTIASTYERLATLTDTFLLFAALSSTGTLAFDSVPLTMVRRHESNTSKSGPDISRRRAAWGVVEDLVRASASNPMLNRYLALREARALIFDHVIGVPSSRQQLWRAMETAVRAARFSGLRNTVLYSAMGLASTVSFPWLGAVAPLITTG